jgi:hypothetical protein
MQGRRRRRAFALAIPSAISAAMRALGNRHEVKWKARCGGGAFVPQPRFKSWADLFLRWTAVVRWCAMRERLRRFAGIAKPSKNGGYR